MVQGEPWGLHGFVVNVILFAGNIAIGSFRVKSTNFKKSSKVTLSDFDETPSEKCIVATAQLSNTPQLTQSIHKADQAWRSHVVFVAVAVATKGLCELRGIRQLAPSSMSFPRYGHLKFGRDPSFRHLRIAIVIFSEFESS